MALILVVLPALSILTACIGFFHRPYPGGWGSPPSITDNVCTDISGTFSVIGEMDTERTDNKISFVSFFWRDFKKKKSDASKLDEATSVTIEQVTDVVRITVWANNTMIAQKDLRKGERYGYSCTTQGILARVVLPHVSGLVGYIGETIILFKVSDGSLIVKSQSSGGGLMLIIPVYGSGTDWFRFRPYRKP